jgi:hypothetical protein
MQRRTILAVAALVGLFGGRAGAEPDLQLDVLVHDRARVVGPDLVVALSTAHDLFAAEHVRVVWHRHESPGAPVERLTIVLVAAGPDFDAMIVDPNTLGRVVCPRVRAYVLYDRIATFAQAHKADPGRILGQVIAHEIGHLILGPGHSPEGLMAPRLDPRIHPNPAFLAVEGMAIRAALLPHDPSLEARRAGD